MNLTDKFGIGIVGCGTIADVHAETIQRLAKAQLVSVYSRNLSNARRVGQKFNVTWRDNWEEFINDDQIDIVSICTPSGTHLDYGKLVAEAGKHVVVEKPIEVTLERGKQLIDVCSDNHVKLAVIFQNRFQPEVQQMKRRIDAGELGDIFLGDAYIKWFRTQEYYDSAQWRGTYALDGGGVLINQAIHTIDLLLWIMGEVETIYAEIGTFTHERIEGEDTAVAVLRFQNGALGVIEGSTSIRPANARRLEIHGKNGTAILTGDALSFFGEGSSQSKSITNQKSPEKSGASSPLQDFSIAPHEKQFEAIVDALDQDKIPPVSGKESLVSLVIILAIYESAKKGHPVTLTEFIKSKLGQLWKV